MAHASDPFELPTVQDVARMAGVSTATVSRCLNNPAQLRPATRAKVQEAVRALGYTPHFGGRALASNRTNTVGVVIPTMENAIFARGVQAMQETLAEAGVTLLIASSGYDPEREADQIRALLGRGVDGMLLIGEARPEESYALLTRRRTPYVLVWTRRPGCAHPCVGFDNRAAARMLAEQALALGHRDIAMISGVTRGNDRAAERVAGVRDALVSAGLALRDDRLVEAPYTLADGAAAFRALFAESRRPTLVLCGNDVLAAGALKAARALGLTVPGDVSVVGFDDIDLAEACEPGLTTVHVPHRRMGAAAARALLQMRDGTEAALPPAFAVTLTRRGSLGPPPRR
jgi:LacI family transcriptional regulator